MQLQIYLFKEQNNKVSITIQWILEKNSSLLKHLLLAQMEPVLQTKK